MIDLVNSALRCNTPTIPHNMDDMEKAIVREATPTIQLELTGLTRDPYLRQSKNKLSAYIDVFVNNFLELDQGPAHRRRQVWQIFFHILDKVLCTCESGDLKNRKEVLLLKNLLVGDFTWSVF